MGIFEVIEVYPDICEIYISAQVLLGKHSSMTASNAAKTGRLMVPTLVNQITGKVSNDQCAF